MRRTRRPRRRGPAAQAAAAGAGAAARPDAGVGAGVGAAPPLYREALVVFSGNSDIWWLGWLKEGFRHCFIAFNDGRHWITLDPLSHRTEVAVQDVPADFDLRAFYEARGLRCVTAALAPTPLRCAPPGPFTCVEAVKRALGLRAPLVWTPRQLHRRLTRRPRQARQAADGRRTGGAGSGRCGGNAGFSGIS